MKTRWKTPVFIVVAFLGAFYMPLDSPVFRSGVMESLSMLQEYARNHVILCLLPALFIAGSLAVFLKRDSVMRYLGPKAKKAVAYAAASVSGSILAVCSCTVLPLFAGIYRMGAGLGPACAFLYSGPAINILAIILTARILGFSLGLARAAGAVLFSILIGLSMHFLYRDEEKKRASGFVDTPVENGKPLWQTVIFFASLVGVLVFTNWSNSANNTEIMKTVFGIKWYLTSFFAMAAALATWRWLGVKAWKLILSIAGTLLAVYLGAGITGTFMTAIIGFSISIGTSKGQGAEWFNETWGFAKLILPLLFLGVIIAGALLGRPGHQGWIPEQWVSVAVGGNSFRANLLASVAGAFMYFATLTEVPIVQGLIGSGMGKGPALALLLAGPALSLPNMLVIRTVLGTKKTVTFVGLVVVMATTSGIIFGAIT